MTAPDKIWAAADPEDGWRWPEASKFPMQGYVDQVEYTRTDLIPNAAYVAGLEEAVQRVDEYWDVSDYAVPSMHRKIKAALSARPDAPDTRVVNVAQLDHIETLIRAANGRTDVDDHTLDMAVEALRAIIGEVKE